MKKISKILVISALSAATITALGACKKKQNNPPAPSTYTVNFIVNGVSVYSEEVKKNGNYESGYSVTDIDGYDFSGWFTDDGCTTDATFPVKVSSDLNFYGEWIEEKYTLTHKDGDTQLSSAEYFKAAYLVAPEAPEKEGYRFNGWYSDEECTKLFDYVEDQMPAHDMTLYAGWTTLYAVNYELNGGTGEAKEYFAKDEAIVEPEKPQKENFVFTGWFTDAACTKAYAFDSLMTEDGVTLYAGWRPVNNNITLTFVNDGQTVATITGIKEGDFIPAYNGAKLEKDKFVFDGWFYDENCTQYVYDGQLSTTFRLAGVNDVITFYAGWHLNEKYATVTLQIGDKTQEVYVEKGTKFSQGTAGVSVEIPAGTVLAGYTQNGEGYDEDTLVYGNTTLVVNYYTEGLVFAEVSGGYAVTDYTGTATTVYIPSVYEQSPVVAIGASAFADTAVVGVEFAAGSPLKAVGEDAFKNTPFETAAKQKEFTYLADRVLYLSTVSGQDVTLGSNIVAIASNAFAGTAVKTVTAPSVVYVGKGAFAGCASLTSFKGASRMETIEANAFAGCTSLVEATVNGVTAIADGTFTGCTSLTKMVLPAAIKTVGKEAFAGCANLARVEFGTSIQGSSLVSVGENAFAGCTSLTVIVAYGAVPFTVQENAIPDGVTVYVKANYVDAYKTALPAFAEKIDSVTNIPVEG